MNGKIIRLTVAVLLTAMIASFMCVSVSAFVVDPKFSLQNGKKCSSLAEALEKAADVDVITQDSNLPVYETGDSFVITKNITLVTGKDFFGGTLLIRYTGTEKPFLTVENGGKLTLHYATLAGGTMSESVKRGGLIVVKAGGTLVLDGTDAEPVVLKDSRLVAADSKGGAVYVEAGGTVVVNGVTYENNAAAEENDIFLENGAIDDPKKTDDPKETEDQTITKKKEPKKSNLAVRIILFTVLVAGVAAVVIVIIRRIH